MSYRISHTTRYEYEDPVTVCHNQATLIPSSSSTQNCLACEITIDPVPSDYQERTDFFGNRVAYFAIEQPHKVLTVTANSLVELFPLNPTAHPGQISWEQTADYIKNNHDEQTLEAQQYTLNSTMVTTTQEMADYAKRSFLDNRPILDAVSDLMERIHRDFTYDPDFSAIATPLSEILKHRRGVCQDFAHLAIACLRSLGLAARYVSGYIETMPPMGETRLIGSDASHAWFSVFIPELGWLDFDPTNNQTPIDKHITIAVGRDYYDVTPLKGVIFGGGKHKLSVSVDVAKA